MAESIKKLSSTEIEITNTQVETLQKSLLEAEKLSLGKEIFKLDNFLLIANSAKDFLGEEEPSQFSKKIKEKTNTLNLLKIRVEEITRLLTYFK